MSDFEYKMVIVTRKDLKLSTGKLSVQVAHAAVECALYAKKNKSKWFKKWYNEGGKKTVVKVEKLQDFYLLKEKAKEIGIHSKIIEDAGHTEISPGTKTVLGLGPGPSNIMDKITGSLSLL